MSRHLQIFLCLLAAVALLGAPTTSRAKDEEQVLNKPPTAKDYADLGKLPDWSGMWIPVVSDQIKQMTTNPPPWTPKVAAQVKQQTDDQEAGKPLGIFVDCLPEGMPSWMLISHNFMEVAFTPGKIFLLGDSDGNRLRRIYTDGRPHPDDPDLTFHGHSIGHWEGDTLVVDTVGIKPETWLAIGEAQGIPNNGDMHVVERIHLIDANTLADELTITAPKVLTKPWKTTRLFERERRRDLDIVEGVCIEGSFRPEIDKNGNHVFVPAPRTPDGNRMNAQ
ncbi:MAG TPA: hypothetical protein VG735_00730 [Caulobacterales bacterium]|nr:hypothetical protein [Caulobacterales bacterium]